jgi:hypothetical protein
MKMRKPATPSRRGFLARLAAIGTVLGGVVTPPQANPLPPAASALLYSSALADAEVKMLLASAGPGVSIMPPEHTYDMGAQGQGMALPVKNSSGIVTAYLIYGSTDAPNASAPVSTPVIKLLLKDNGTVTVALNGKTYPAPPDAADEVEILYASFFTDKFVQEQATAELKRQAIAGAQRGQQLIAGPLDEAATCIKQFSECVHAIAKNKGAHIYLSLIACIFCTVKPANAGPAVALACVAHCAHVANNIRNWNIQLLACVTKLRKCLDAITQPKFIA